jgi:hypothetical protein
MLNLTSELEEIKSQLRVSWLAHMVRGLVRAYATRCELALRFDTTVLRRGTSMARAFSRGETDESECVGAVGGHVPGGLGDVVPAGES